MSQRGTPTRPTWGSEEGQLAAGLPLRHPATPQGWANSGSPLGPGPCPSLVIVGRCSLPAGRDAAPSSSSRLPLLRLPLVRFAWETYFWLAGNII